MALQTMPPHPSNTPPASQPPIKPRRQPVFDWLERMPWWLLVAILLGALMLWLFLTNADYQVIFRAVSQGVVTTIWVTLVSFAGALVVGRGNHSVVLHDDRADRHLVFGQGRFGLGQGHSHEIVVHVGSWG